MPPPATSLSMFSRHILEASFMLLCISECCNCVSILDINRSCGAQKNQSKESLLSVLRSGFRPRQMSPSWSFVDLRRHRCYSLGHQSRSPSASLKETFRSFGTVGKGRRVSHFTSAHRVEISVTASSFSQSETSRTLLQGAEAAVFHKGSRP